MSQKSGSSEYVLQARKNYFLYVLTSRALPHLADGLKPSQRRVLWTGRNGEKTKTATLAGATLPIHPHSTPDDVISNMAGPWLNNFPLFTGIGAFGTMIFPRSAGAPRYTSVKVSDFTKEVLFADIDLVPMQLNYDDTLEEPTHFLPLVPVVLLNPVFGIAGGFQCSILPRSLSDVIDAQIAFLKGKEIQDVLPYFTPTDCRATGSVLDPKTNHNRYTFVGEFTRINSSKLRVTKLPYGIEHSKFIDHLSKLEDDFVVSSFDDHSKNQIDIVVQFPRGFVDSTSQPEMIRLLKLSVGETEYMNVIDFDGTTVKDTSFVEVIQSFTQWRLQYYIKRYSRLRELLQLDIQKYRDIILAINKNVGGIAAKTKSKSELCEFLEDIGVVNIDYIAALQVYRFTEEEKLKIQHKLEEALSLHQEYKDIITDDARRVNIYINELKAIKKRFT